MALEQLQDARTIRPAGLRERLAWMLAAALFTAGASLVLPPGQSESSGPHLTSRAPAPLFDPGLAQAQLEDPARDEWQKPAEIVRTLDLRPGQTVADIGAGSGYLMPYLSRAVGPEGRVYAQEIQPGFLSKLRAKAGRHPNVRVVPGSAEDPGLPPQSVDCFVLLTVYHEVAQPVRFLRALRYVSRPGARLAIIDFDASRHGTPPAPSGHELPAADVVAEARAAGWRLEQRHELLSSQFFLVFRRAEVTQATPL